MSTSRLTEAFIALLTLVLTLSPLAQATQDQMQVRVFIDSYDDLTQLNRLHVDQVWQQETYVEIIADQDMLDRIQSLGFKTEIVHQDVVRFLQSRLDKTKDMGGYKTLAEINAHIDDLIALHPTIISSKISIGQSVEGRDIWAIKVSDNPNVDEDEPKVLYTALHHAREVITPEVLFFFIERLANFYGTWPVETALVDSREMWFILCVNPDGYYHNEVIEPDGGGMWRKNRRDNGDGTFGVDLNRNYSYEWGYDDVGSSPDPDDQTYRGTGPFSEPETQAVRDFIIARGVTVVVDYHAYGNQLFWPWGYTYGRTPDAQTFRSIGDSLHTLNGYQQQYLADRYTLNGASSDWIYGEQETKQKVFAVLPEVGTYNDNFWPDPTTIYDLAMGNLEANIFYAQLAGDPQSILRSTPPTVLAPEVVDSATFEVQWTPTDEHNPAIEYELQELQGFQRITDSANSLGNWESNGFIIQNGTFFAPFEISSNKSLTLTEPITVQPGDTLKFRFKSWNWGFYNWFFVMVSTNGVNYEPIPGNITIDTPHPINLGHGQQGSQLSWTDALFDLSAFEGQTIYIRFLVQIGTWYENGEQGINIDNVSPVPTYGSQTIISSALTDTSYSFFDHQVGEYVYRVKTKDSDGQWSLPSKARVVNVVSNYACIDSDGDGYGDPGNPGNICADDNCPSIANVGQEDADGDGQGDVCDPCPLDADDDADGDSFCANVDNCPNEYNPAQDDSDGDGIGDLCDACPNDPDNDIDGDGVCGDVDNCPLADNPNQEDSDGDLLGDACDNCSNDYNPGQEDLDSDNWGDICDNCPDLANDQTDSDGDLIGDLCDVCPNDSLDDIDADSYCADVDNCPDVYNPDQADSDGDGIGDVCCCLTRGDVDHAGGPSPIDIADLVYLVDFMFSGGPIPPCTDEGDIDGVGEAPIDISDLVYLVDFMFVGGAAPPDCS